MGKRRLGTIDIQFPNAAVQWRPKITAMEWYSDNHQLSNHDVMSLRSTINTHVQSH